MRAFPFPRHISCGLENMFGRIINYVTSAEAIQIPPHLSLCGRWYSRWFPLYVAVRRSTSRYSLKSDFGVVSDPSLVSPAGEAVRDPHLAYGQAPGGVGVRRRISRLTIVDGLFLEDLATKSWSRATLPDFLTAIIHTP